MARTVSVEQRDDHEQSIGSRLDPFRPGGRLEWPPASASSSRTRSWRGNRHLGGKLFVADDCSGPLVSLGLQPDPDDRRLHDHWRDVEQHLPARIRSRASPGQRRTDADAGASHRQPRDRRRQPVGLHRQLRARRSRPTSAASRARSTAAATWAPTSSAHPPTPTPTPTPTRTRTPTPTPTKTPTPHRRPRFLRPRRRHERPHRSRQR